jgi:GAF domain-containing protein/anti-sigma regulatory factor (Ser/Thr protein kinase)
MPVVWDDIGGLIDAYERFMAGEQVGEDVRGSILASWRRCKGEGLVPGRVVIPQEKNLDLDRAGPLLHAAAPVLDRLVDTLAGAKVSIFLTDGQARVLQRRGGEAGLDRHLDVLCLAPGFGFAEMAVGTNGVGTALADRRPTYVAGREHFAECMQPFACAGAPIRHPLSGRVEGALDLTCYRTDADPTMIALVEQAVAGIEERLLEQATDRERHLLDAFFQVRPCTRTPGDVFGPVDQALLREKAEELIAAAPRRAVTEVALTGGGTVTLRCREVTGPEGEAGVVVEAAVPDGVARVAARQLDGTARSAAPGLGEAAAPWPGGPVPGVTAPVPEVPETFQIPQVPIAAAAPDTLVLLAGEPGVGRLALLARRRLELLYQAGVRIGTTLDVTRTAEELAEAVVPRFADFAAVDVPESVIRGEEPVSPLGGLRRVALGGIRQGSYLYEIDKPVSYVPATPQARCLESGTPVLEAVLGEAVGRIADDPVCDRRTAEAGVHSLITVPMRARGVILGVASFYRAEHSGAFEEDDLSLAEELVGRAAVCIDNARRFTREHTMALALQRSLLPRGLPEQNAVEAAHRYLPARAGVGGDWFDVIPLSGARVALVVGDVVGHGVHAAATMGRLRTAVYNFSALDLPPEDVLARLDDLVGRLDDAAGPDGGADAAGNGIAGATCLYAVYDPVVRRCAFARAGHPLPALVRPDGTVTFPDLPAGLPLGLGGLPFETVDVEVPEDTQLVLYTDGLLENRGHDIDLGVSRLRDTLVGLAARPGRRSPDETCEAVLEAMLPRLGHPSDDVALIVARTRAVDPGRTAHWEVSAEPAAVCGVRAAVIERLAEWGLDDLAFITELIVSELVTNAVRYGDAPIGLRLIRDRALICEVCDGSSTSPRLRRARTTDEGGRGLFLVAQLAQRWGTRYTAEGKIIWTEQPLP